MKTQSNREAKQKMQPLKTRLRNYIGKRLFGVGPTDDWSYVDQFSGPAKDVKLLGMYSGITYRCIDTISTSIGGKYEPYLYTLGANGKKTTVANHPFINLLVNPNPDISQYQLFEGTANFMEQFGECFWYMVGGSLSGYKNGVKEIYLLRPDKVGITLNKSDGSILGYTYNSGVANTKIPFKPEEIIHIRTFNPRNPYRGYSTLEAAIDYVQTELEVSKFTRNYFQNNAAMSGVLEVTSKMSKEAWQKFVRQWRERYQGVGNAGKVGLVRDSQFKFTPVSSSISDMQLTDLKQTTIDNILMMFKIPKGLMGMESGEGLGRASVETLEYIYTKWTIDDKLCRLDDTIKKCLARYYPQDKVLVDHVSIIPSDKVYDLAFYTAAVDKWMTRADIRAKDPDLANTKIDGDDQLFVAINVVPLSDGATLAEDKPAPVVPPVPAKDPVDPDDDGDDDTNDEGDTDDDSSKSIRLVKAGASKKKVVKSLKSLKYSIEQKEAFRLNLQKNADAYSRVYAKALTKVLDKQEKTVKGNIQHLAASWNSKALSDDLFDMGEEDDNMDSELTPVTTDMALTQGALALVFAGDHDTNYDLSKSVLNALKKSTKKMSQNFNQETLDRLNATLTEGITAGESLSKLDTRVADVYDQAKSYRTERVARTESQSASNAATLDAYKQTSYVVAKEWFANPGACDFCAEMDGTQIGLTEVFVNQGDSVDVHTDDGDSSYQADYGDIDGPPLHPNCVTGDTIIISPDAKHILKSSYSGKIINIKTANGRHLSVTPNHVILTDRGWVVAKLISKSDNIISQTISNKIISGNPDADYSPSTIADVFNSIRESSSVTTSRVPVSTEYLKGDAAFCKGDIDIISANGFLRDSVEIGKKLQSFLFNGGCAAVDNFPGLCDFTSMLIALGATSDGNVSLSDVPSLFSRSSFSHIDDINFFSTSNYNARLAQAASDSRSTYIEPFTKVLDTIASVIEIDNVIDVQVNDFHGDIYDVSSQSTLYSANGVITSNCECTIIPVTE